MKVSKLCTEYMLDKGKRYINMTSDEKELYLSEVYEADHSVMRQDENERLYAEMLTMSDKAKYREKFISTVLGGIKYNSSESWFIRLGSWFRNHNSALEDILYQYQHSDLLPYKEYGVESNIQGIKVKENEMRLVSKAYKESIIFPSEVNVYIQGKTLATIFANGLSVPEGVDVREYLGMLSQRIQSFVNQVNSEGTIKHEIYWETHYTNVLNSSDGIRKELEKHGLTLKVLRMSRGTIDKFLYEGISDNYKLEVQGKELGLNKRYENYHEHVSYENENDKVNQLCRELELLGRVKHVIDYMIKNNYSVEIITR